METKMIWLAIFNFGAALLNLQILVNGSYYPALTALCVIASGAAGVWCVVNYFAYKE